MHKKRTRSQQIAIRFFTYGAMTLLAVLGVVLCLMWAMGFRIDWDGKLTQVALLQFDSFPTGATVDINGQALSTRTPTRSNVKTGENTVIMSRQGYRSWRKTVNMLPSGVVWLNYTRFIPSSITTDTTKNFAVVTGMRESPDRRWLLLLHLDDERCKDVAFCPEMTPEAYRAMPFTLTLADISDPKNVRFSELTIPSDKIAWPSTGGKGEKFSIVEWDHDSRFILIKHVVGEMTEYLELDRTNAGVVKNLTRDFGMQISEPHFSGTSGNVFFALTDASLRKFDYGNNTASAPLASDVQSYRMSEDGRLVLVTVETKDEKTIQKVSIYHDGHVTAVKIYSGIEPTLTLLARFGGTDYLAIARHGDVAIYPKPLENNKSQPIYLNSLGGIDWLDSSPKEQFILAGRENRLISFDLDTELRYSFEVEGMEHAPQWLDSSHIVSTSGDHITFIEFDGQNREDIVGAHGRVSLSRDNKYLFSIDNIPGGAILQRSKLVVD